jgi:hypothetical protein
MSRPLLTGVLLAALALPSTAGAASFAPPGNSGIDQYRETIPDAGGNGTTPRHHGPARHDSAVSSGTRGQLSALGSEGRQTAAAADTTAPPGVTATASGSSRAAGSKRTRPASAPPAPSGTTTVTGSGDSPLTTLARVLTTGAGSGAGMGVALPLLLAAGVFMAAGFVLRRRRSG